MNCAAGAAVRLSCYIILMFHSDRAVSTLLFVRVRWGSGVGVRDREEGSESGKDVKPPDGD